MNKSKIILIIILVLLVINVFLGVKYMFLAKEFRQIQFALESQKTNNKILEFTNLFIEKVLKAEAEINFETRLKLENSVRDLGDDEILARWSKFIESKTEADAQEEVKNLLGILISKININAVN